MHAWWKVSTGMGCLYHLVSTDDLAMRGARVSATLEMSHFSWNILIPAAEGSLKDFFSTSNV